MNEEDIISLASSMSENRHGHVICTTHICTTHIMHHGGSAHGTGGHVMGETRRAVSVAPVASYVMYTVVFASRSPTMMPT